MNLSNVVGPNLRSLRVANDYTQEQLANFLGITRSAYANYESGDREMPVLLLEKACDLMGVELSQIFNKEEIKQSVICAFRANNLSDKDVEEVAMFKKIVLNYVKMKKKLK